MKVPRIAHVLFLMALLMSAPAVRAQGPAGAEPLQLIPAGDDRHLWLVRAEDDPSHFSVVVRPAGAEWKWVARNLTGQISAATVATNRLHVFFATGGYRVFAAGGEDMPGPLLPSPALAVCAAEQFAGRPGSEVLAAIGRSAPAATAPAGEADGGASPRANGLTSLLDLAILQSEPTGWRELTTLEGIRLSRESRVRIAAVEETVFLLVANAPGGANVLYAWSGEDWGPVQLPEEARNASIWTMLALDERLVLGLAEPAEAPRQVLLALARQTEEGGFSLQPVGPQDQRPTWPTDSPPAAAPFGGEGQLALVWRSEGVIHLAFSSPTGEFSRQDEVEVFQRPPADGRGARVHEKFLWGLTLTIFVLLFVLRPRTPPTPFVIPEGMIPGSLPKRIVAALIDAVPFLLLVPVVVFPEVFAKAPPEGAVTDPWEHARRIAEQNPDAAIYSYLISLCVYTLYATLTEWKWGATLGKRLMRLRVVGNEGQTADGRQIVLRNLARLIPLSSQILVPLLIVFPLLNANRQRLGDMLARTTVIDDRSKPVPRETSEEESRQASPDQDAEDAPPRPDSDEDGPADPRP